MKRKLSIREKGLTLIVLVIIITILLNVLTSCGSIKTANEYETQLKEKDFIIQTLEVALEQQRNLCKKFLNNTQ